MSYTLRPYQQEAVDLAIKYMRKNSRECKKINGQWDDDWSSDYANYARKTGEAMIDIFERRLEILLFMTYATNEATVKEVHELATTDLTLAAVKKIVREFLEGGYIESRLNGRKLFYRPSKKSLQLFGTNKP